MQYYLPRYSFSFNSPTKTDKLTKPHSLKIGVTHTPTIGLSHTPIIGVTQTDFEATGVYKMNNRLQPCGCRRYAFFMTAASDYFCFRHLNSTSPWPFTLAPKR